MQMKVFFYYSLMYVFIQVFFIYKTKFFYNFIEIQKKNVVLPKIRINLLEKNNYFLPNSNICI